MGFPYQREGPLSQGGVENGGRPSIGSPRQEWCFRFLSRNRVGLWSRRTWTGLSSLQTLHSQSNDRDRRLYGIGTPVDVEHAFGPHRNRVRKILDFFQPSTRLIVPPRSFSCGLEGDPHLKRCRDVRIIVRLRVAEIGTYRDTLEIRFSRVSNNQLFCVTRTVKATVGDEADYALLRPTAPYVPRRRSDRQEINDGDVVAGVPPPRLTAIAWRSKLGRYNIPESYRPRLSLQPNRSDTGEDIVPKEIRSLMPTTFRLSTHAQQFCLLLWLEEISMEYAVHLAHSKLSLNAPSFSATLYGCMIWSLSR